MARYAVLVGINDYANQSVPSLRFAEHDAQTLETLPACLTRRREKSREAPVTIST